jgi:hypothetical protein
VEQNMLHSSSSTIHQYLTILSDTSLLLAGHGTTGLPENMKSSSGDVKNMDLSTKR